MRSSSGTTWSFHAVHSISAIVSAPYRLATSAAHPSTQSCRYALAPRQELGGERLLREVGEAQVGPVRPAVVGELGAGVDVELLADVEVGLRVGDAVVHPRELRVVDEVDAEHEDEVVGDDTLLEVGSGLADLEELVELRVGRRALTPWSRPASRSAGRPSRSAKELADRLGDASRSATLVA